MKKCISSPNIYNKDVNKLSNKKMKLPLIY